MSSSSLTIISTLPGSKSKRRANRSSEEAYAGSVSFELQGDLSATTQPAGKRIRRMQGRSSSELIEIRHDIRNEDYRTGGPELCRLPTVPVDYPLSKADELWRQGEQPLFRGVLSILEQWKVEAIQMGIAALMFEYSTAEAPAFQTVIVKARKNKLDNDWLYACLDIRRLFASLDVPNLNIEIYDDRARQLTMSRLVEENHPIASKWPVMRQEILQVLEDRDWVAMELLRRQKEGEVAAPVTIVVTIAEDTDQEGWDAISDKIGEILDKSNMANVPVEILRGNMLYSAPANYTYATLIADDAWSKIEVAKPGDSIGQTDTTKGTGSFGGFVIVKFANGTKLTLGLTCYHCAIAIDSPRQSELKWAQNGIRPNDPENDLRIGMPSVTDLKNTLARYDALIEDAVNHKDYKHAVSQLSDTDGFLTPGSQRAHSRVLAEVERLKALKQTAMEFFDKDELYLGDVYAASGFRMDETKKCALDWALIKIQPFRQIGRNTLPLCGDIPKFGTSHLRYDPPFPEIKSKRTAEPGDIVYKVGRSTGLTVGTCTHIPDSFTLRSWRKTPDGSFIELVTCELAVASGNAFSSDPGVKGAGFGTAGDSGAVVFDKNGNMVGLLFAGNDRTRISYFTPVEELFNDIKAITGAVGVYFP